MRKTAIFLSALSLGLAACGSDAATETTDEAATSDEAVAADDDASEASEMVESEDALVEGTEYNATSMIPCGFDGAAPTQTCNAGVIRNWGEDGSALVEVQKPDGFKRAIFFNGREPIGADSAEADGSAGWDFETSRDGDRVTIMFGPETYVIVDAMIEGG